MPLSLSLSLPLSLSQQLMLSLSLSLSQAGGFSGVREGWAFKRASVVGLRMGSWMYGIVVGVTGRGCRWRGATGCYRLRYALCASFFGIPKLPSLSWLELPVLSFSPILPFPINGLFFFFFFLKRIL
jgi:hypothetical protein